MRLIKQFLYGVLFIAILVALIWGFYNMFLKSTSSCFDNKKNQNETDIDCGGSCISCELKNIKPLVLGQTQLYSGDRIFSVSVPVENTNPQFGIENFSYKFSIYDKDGNVLETVEDKSFIYPSEKKDLISAGMRITNGYPDHADFKIDESSIKWENPENFYAPAFELKDVTASQDNDVVTISGYVSNVNNFVISKAIADVFVLDKNGQKINASRTELNNIGQFRIENFKILIPILKSQRDSIDLDSSAKTVYIEILK